MILNQLLNTVFNIKRPRFMKFQCNAMRPIFPLSQLNCILKHISFVFIKGMNKWLNKTLFIGLCKMVCFIDCLNQYVQR